MYSNALYMLYLLRLLIPLRKQKAAKVDYMMDKFLNIDTVLNEIERDGYIFEFVLCDGVRAGYLAAVNEL